MDIAFLTIIQIDVYLSNELFGTPVRIKRHTSRNSGRIHTSALLSHSFSPIAIILIINLLLVPGLVIFA
jgi:hypothetical protein